MFNKKGIGFEIDWILGVGLFILSIAFIFVFFKPGVKPIHDSQTLLNILQTGFEENVKWEVTEVPLFITPVYRDYYGNSGTALLDNAGFDVARSIDSSGGVGNYYNQLSELIDGKLEENIKLFYVLREIPGLGEEAPPLTSYDAGDNPVGEVEDFCTEQEDSELSSQELEFREEFCDENTDEENDPGRSEFGQARRELHDYGSGRESVPHGRTEREHELEFTKVDDIGAESLIVPVYLDDNGGKTKYILTVSNKPINFFTSEPLTEPTYKGCFALGGEFDLSPSLVLPLRAEDRETTCDILYELGATEKLSGIHYPSLLSLENIERDNCRGYGCIKEDWKFPASKEFVIEVESIPESEVGSSTCNTQEQLCFKLPKNLVEPPKNINVFVRQFNSFVLTDDGLKVPVIVRISLW